MERLVGQGWTQEWRPIRRRLGRRGRVEPDESWWVQRVGGEVRVYPRPRADREPYFYVRGNLVFRAPGHPEGPSPLPSFVTRGRAVYPGDGYPGGPSGRALFQIEFLRQA